MPQAQAEIS